MESKFIPPSAEESLKSMKTSKMSTQIPITLNKRIDRGNYLLVSQGSLLKQSTEHRKGPNHRDDWLIQTQQGLLPTHLLGEIRVCP